MKTAPLLSLAAVCLLAHCDKSPKTLVSTDAIPAAAAPPAAPSAPLITSHASPHFMKVVSQLDLGGSSFNYADQDGLMEAIAILLDQAVKNIPAEQRKELPPQLSFVKLFNDLGLGGVKAIGASSRRTDSGLYHSRSFAFMPEGQKGLLSLNGGPAEPFLTHQAAPKGTDLALELPLHLKTLAKDSLASVLGMVPEKSRPEVEASLAQPVPTLGITTRELLEKLDARLGLFIRLYPDQQLPLPGAEFPVPGADILLVADRLGWLLEPLKQQFMPLLQTPALPVDVVDKDGVFSVTFKAPVGPAPMDFQPILHFDSKTDRLMISTRAAFLNSALQGKELLSSGADFKAAWTGLPEQGNSALYVSPVFLQTLHSNLLQSIARSSEESEAFKEAAGKALEFLTPYISHSQALCVSNQPDGTLGAANLAFPLGNTSTLSAITSVAIISSLAVPTFNSINVKANQAKIGNEARQIGLALQTYAADHNGQYPHALEDLKTDGLIEALPTTTIWLYNSTLTDASPGDSIILASDLNAQGKRCVVRKSGISEFISESQFEIEKDDNLQ